MTGYRCQCCEWRRHPTTLPSARIEASLRERFRARWRRATKDRSLLWFTVVYVIFCVFAAISMTQLFLLMRCQPDHATEPAQVEYPTCELE